MCFVDNLENEFSDFFFSSLISRDSIQMVLNSDRPTSLFSFEFSFSFSNYNIQKKEKMNYMYYNTLALAMTLVSANNPHSYSQHSLQWDFDQQ